MRIRKHLSRIAFTGDITATNTTTAAAAAATTSSATIIIPSSSTSPCKRGRANNLQQTDVCELNRSPWDVISFSPQLSSDMYFPPHQYQVVLREDDNGDDSSVTENTIDDESVIAFKSITSLKEEAKEEKEEEESEEEETEDEEKRFSLLVDVDEEKRKKKLGFVCCNKTDGKGWKCGREAKRGHSLCEHHITQLRSYHYAYTHPTRKSDTIKASTTKTTVTPTIASGWQPRNKSRLSSGKSGTDFYYYSGFGPLWGKKRRGGEGEGNDNTPATKREKEREIIEDEAQVEQIQIQASQQQTPLSYVDYDDYDDDDDDDGDEDGGRKRIRKPIKARSLKSLL